MPRRWATLALIAALLLALGVGLGWRALEARRLRSALESADAALAAGRADEACSLLADLDRGRPGRGDVLLRLGQCELDAGRVDTALEAWGRVAPGDPDAGPIAMRRAALALDHGRLAAAEEALDRAFAEGGVNPDEALSALARAFRLQGRRAELRRRIVDGLGRSAVPAELLRMLWQIDAEPLPVERVRLLLEQAGREAPGDDRLWLARAHLETQSGRYPEADAWLARCEAARPGDPAVARARLDWAVAAGEPGAAVEALGRLGPDPLRPAEAEALRAWFAARAGDRAAEADALEALLRADPGDPEALERLAVLAAEGGDSARVAEFRRRKAEVDDAREGFKKLLARGDLGQARELARLAKLLGRRLESRAWALLAAEPEHDGPRVRETLARFAREEPTGVEGGTLLAEVRRDDRPALAQADAPGASARGAAPTFVDAAESAGLRFVFDNGETPERQFPESGSGGVGLLDFDGDGWLDVYCIQAGPFPPEPGRPNADRLYRNRGDGTFEDATERSGVAAFPGGYGHGVTVGDVDNDGHPDLFITRWRQYALYRNRGDGTFEDVTESWGLGGDRDWPTSAALADLDNDGDLDLYVCHYLVWDSENPRICRHHETGQPSYCDPSSLPHLPDRLFRNDGGRFVDVTEEAGIVDPDGRGLGVVAVDLDDDGLLDLYVANDMTANFLFRNLGGMKFEEVGSASGVAGNASGGYQAGMGVAAGDLDGDGRPDLVVTNFYGESTTLYGNLGGGLFADRTAPAGLAAPTRFMLGFGVAMLDADNDGRLDLIQANGHVNDFRPDTPYMMPAQLFLGDDRGRLVDATGRAGPAFQPLRVGRGLAVGDLDNDGRVDAVLVSHREPAALFHNRTADPGRFATFRLEGTESNRDGVGARVRVVAGGRERVAQRVGGGSYQSANDGRLHFGLGATKAIDSVEVAWPSGRVDRHEGLAAGRGYLLREGDPTPTPLPGFGGGANP